MVAFYVLIISFFLFLGMGQMGLSYFDSWHTSLQAAIAAMLLIAASARWGKRKTDLIRMVPSIFPRPDLIVLITGLLEIAAAIGILIPSMSRLTSICLAILLIAMFPANIKASKERLTIAGKHPPSLWLRTSIQVTFIVLVLLAG
ncbi:hypothetical protein CN326_08930 [Bacillus sp. AFS018417]|uniref:DoxX family protein n=1 Tax=unclassified Bacillus (in: firmicutes) TaxID=185979 RepID=UPI000BF8B49E|nr:hypothetical protein [Bacillus sp. AFS018417]PEZ07260.1 hypothetical protein CN326_08930 [Bacillus sp. AFS018417]